MTGPITTAAPWQRLGKKLTMGLQSCPPEEWLLTPDLFGDDAMHQRQLDLIAELSRDRHGDVFAAMPGSAAAGQETFDLIRKHLETDHGKSIRQDSHLHPLDAAARQIPEDVLLLAPEAQNGKTIWVLKAAALALPSHWVLAEKMNRPMAGIHQPVPDYDKVLEKPVDRFFNAMLTGPISLRRNWALQIDDGLFTPSRHDHAPLAAEDVGQRLFVRVERQTLRKLSTSGWIVFTIQTALTPIDRWQDDAAALGDLIEQIADMAPLARDYRGVDAYWPQLRDWVDQHITAT